MDVPPETIILIVAVLILAAVGYLQLRYIRSRKQDKLAVRFEADDAYNALATTRAVAASLRQNGRDTTEAETLIYQAEGAYERREFTACTELAERAKTSLRNCKEKDLLSAPVPAAENAKTEGSTEVPAAEVRKLPPNSLESKFMIDSVADQLTNAPEEGRLEAQEALDQARLCYDRGEYTEALKEAMRARRALATTKGEGSKTDRPKVVAPATTGKPAPKSAGCGSCGAALDEGDDFCHACGAKKVQARICPSCSKEASPEDAFCRKCGTKIGLD